MICRSATQMTDSAREKISMFSHVDINQVICMPDVSNIYKVPIILYEHKVAEWLADRFSLKEVSQKLHEANSLSVIRSNSINVDDMTKSYQIMQKWIELHDRYTLYIFLIVLLSFKQI